MTSPDGSRARGVGFRVGWWLACLAVLALAGWGIGQLVVAAQAPGAPPALPAQILALPSGAAVIIGHVDSKKSVAVF